MYYLMMWMDDVKFNLFIPCLPMTPMWYYTLLLLHRYTMYTYDLPCLPRTLRAYYWEHSHCYYRWQRHTPRKGTCGWCATRPSAMTRLSTAVCSSVSYSPAHAQRSFPSTACVPNTASFLSISLFIQVTSELSCSVSSLSDQVSVIANSC